MNITEPPAAGHPESGASRKQFPISADVAPTELRCFEAVDSTTMSPLPGLCFVFA
jgi:hypothetical protein